MSERTVVQQYQHCKLQRKCSSPENNATYDITVDPWGVVYIQICRKLDTQTKDRVPVKWIFYLRISERRSEMESEQNIKIYLTNV